VGEDADSGECCIRVVVMSREEDQFGNAHVDMRILGNRRRSEFNE